jgi:hypothetical protein
MTRPDLVYSGRLAPHPEAIAQAELHDRTIDARGESDGNGARMNCRCGHPERAHVAGGRCRVPDCPCEDFESGDTLPTAHATAARALLARSAEWTIRNSPTFSSIVSRSRVLQPPQHLGCVGGVGSGLFRFGRSRGRAPLQVTKPWRLG